VRLCERSRPRRGASKEMLAPATLTRSSLSGVRRGWPSTPPRSTGEPRRGAAGSAPRWTIAAPARRLTGEIVGRFQRSLASDRRAGGDRGTDRRVGWRALASDDANGRKRSIRHSMARRERGIKRRSLAACAPREGRRVFMREGRLDYGDFRRLSPIGRAGVERSGQSRAATCRASSCRTCSFPPNRSSNDP